MNIFRMTTLAPALLALTLAGPLSAQSLRVKQEPTAASLMERAQQAVEAGELQKAQELMAKAQKLLSKEQAAAEAEAAARAAKERAAAEAERKRAAVEQEARSAQVDRLRLAEAMEKKRLVEQHAQLKAHQEAVAKWQAQQDGEGVTYYLANPQQGGELKIEGLEKLGVYQKQLVEAYGLQNPMQYHGHQNDGGQWVIAADATPHAKHDSMEAVLRDIQKELAGIRAELQGIRQSLGGPAGGPQSGVPGRRLPIGLPARPDAPDGFGRMIIDDGRGGGGGRIHTAAPRSGQGESPFVEIRTRDGDTIRGRVLRVDPNIEVEVETEEVIEEEAVELRGVRLRPSSGGGVNLRSGPRAGSRSGGGSGSVNPVGPAPVAEPPPAPPSPPAPPAPVINTRADQVQSLPPALMPATDPTVHRI